MQMRIVHSWYFRHDKNHMRVTKREITIQKHEHMKNSQLHCLFTERSSLLSSAFGVKIDLGGKSYINRIPSDRKTNY